VFVYAPTAGADDGWTSGPFFLALALCACLLAAFVERERRSPHPIVPLSILRSRTLVAGDAVMFLVGAWMAAEVLLLSLFCQQVLGYSPLVTGLVALPQGLAGIVRGVVAASVVARLGLKRFLLASTAVSAVGLALLLRLPATSHYPLLGVVLFVVGFGTTNALFAATVAGTAAVTDDEQGLAGALVNTARQIGAAVGVSVLVAVAATQAAGSSSTTALDDAYRLALGLSAVLAIAASFVVLFLVEDRAARQIVQLRPHMEPLER
jgi:predicted MFS family arabinose efflux permease